MFNSKDSCETTSSADESIPVQATLSETSSSNSKKRSMDPPMKFRENWLLAQKILIEANSSLSLGSTRNGLHKCQLCGLKFPRDEMLQKHHSRHMQALLAQEVVSKWRRSQLEASITTKKNLPFLPDLLDAKFELPKAGNFMDDDFDPSKRKAPRFSGERTSPLSCLEKILNQKSSSDAEGINTGEVTNVVGSQKDLLGRLMSDNLICGSKFPSKGNFAPPPQRPVWLAMHSASSSLVPPSRQPSFDWRELVQSNSRQPSSSPPLSQSYPPRSEKSIEALTFSELWKTQKQPNCGSFFEVSTQQCPVSIKPMRAEPEIDLELRL